MTRLEGILSELERTAQINKNGNAEIEKELFDKVVNWLSERKPVDYFIDSSTNRLDECCGKCKQRFPNDCIDGVRVCPHCGTPVAQNIWALTNY